MNDVPILAADRLRKQYGRHDRERSNVFAVDDVSVSLFPKETLALVGESGSGKTTTARMLLWLLRPTSGSINFEGIDLANATRTQMRRYRSSVQAVFQDPSSSLNPRMRIRDIIAEPLAVNGCPRKDIESRVREAIKDVGLDADAIDSFPHEFSGGQRQRIAIARAVVMRPRVIVLDEPVSALDVSIRAQIMNLLQDLQGFLEVSYLLISHDLATVRFLATRLAVMHQGRIVEEGDSETVFNHPRHDYTQALIAAARFVRPNDRALQSS